MRRVDSGRSSPRALEFAQFASGIAFEISVEHGHRTESESFDSFQPFSGVVERITGITDEDITTEEISITVPRFPEKHYSMFERMEVIRGVVSENSLSFQVRQLDYLHSLLT